MATEIVLPQWSMGMADGTIVRWLKQEGETVMEGEPLVEVEAAKVTSEVEAEVSGVLTRILAAEGETVPVRTALCVIETAEEAKASASACYLSTRDTGHASSSQIGERPRHRSEPGTWEWTRGTNSCRGCATSDRRGATPGITSRCDGGCTSHSCSTEIGERSWHRSETDTWNWTRWTNNR